MNDFLNQLNPNVILPSLIAAYAAIKASQAEKNSKPVSNGFAKAVLNSLDRIEKRIDSHLENHP